MTTGGIISSSQCGDHILLQFGGMPPRKEVYHEKQEVDSAVWVTCSLVGESLLDQYKPGVDHLLSPRRDARILLGTNLAGGDHRLCFVRHPWSDDQVHLERVLRANILASAVCNQRCGAESVGDQARLVAEQVRQ